MSRSTELDGFDWDDAKAEENFRKHGVTFEDAAAALSDTHSVDVFDDRFDYGEIRVISTAMVKGRILVVVYTERESVIRIISARGAKRNEQDNYYRKNAT